MIHIISGWSGIIATKHLPNDGNSNVFNRWKTPSLSLLTSEITLLFHDEASRNSGSEQPHTLRSCELTSGAISYLTSSRTFETFTKLRGAARIRFLLTASGPGFRNDDHVCYWLWLWSKDENYTCASNSADATAKQVSALLILTFKGWNSW